MEGGKQGSAQDLLQALASCLNYPDSGSARTLQILLAQYRNILLNPLQKKAKSATDRQKVTSRELEIQGGAKRTFNEDFAKKALALSDTLDLNEIICVELLWRADTQKSRYSNLSLLEIAELMFFEGRRQTLEALQMLFVARQTAFSYGDAGILISQFTTELLDSNLLTSLIGVISNQLNLEEKEMHALNSIQKNSNSHSSSSVDSSFVSETQWDHQKQERHIIAEIIFTICYMTVITPPQATALLKLIVAVSTKSDESSAEMNGMNKLYGLYQTNYVLIAALIIALDVCNEHELFDSRGERCSSKLLGDSQFIMDVDAVISTPWKYNLVSDTGSALPHPSQSILKLAWAIFLKQNIAFKRSEASLAPSQLSHVLRDDHIDSLLKNLSPAFLALSSIIRNEIFQNDKSKKMFYLEAFDELVRGFLTTSSGKARDMKSDEENGLRAEAAYQQYKVGPKPPPFTREFEHFLILMATLYKDQPNLASRYWWNVDDRYSKLHSFVRIAGDNLFESNFVAYLQMLSSLASSETCSQQTFRFLQDASRKYLNWDHFFNVLHQYFLDFQQPQYEESGYYDYAGRLPTSRVVKQIRPEEVQALEAILQLMQAVSKYSPLVRRTMLENPTWRALDALFQLLTCPVAMRLKASLIRTITQFARDSSIHSTIWQYLEASKLIPVLGTTPIENKVPNQQKGLVSPASSSGSGHVSGGGIVFELSEIESKEETYPYTLSFVDLLNTLLTNHYFESRDTLADVHLWPYVSFIMKDVFQRFDQRAYKDASEKWKIARSCLKFFLALLRDSVDAFSFSEATFSSHPGGNASASPPSNLTPEEAKQAASIGISRYGSATLKLFRYFLTRSELLQKVIKIVCSEGQLEALIKSRSTGKDTAFEDCVRYSLMIFETVLIRQEPMLTYSRPISLDAYRSKPESGRKLRIGDEDNNILVPLHSLLLRSLADVSTLALYVTYPYNTTIARLSISITHLLSRDTDKMARILHDQNVASEFVNGYITQLETDDLPSKNEDQVHYRGSEESGVSMFGESTGLLDPSDMDDDSAYWASRAPSIREAILSMLLECATQPEYNLTQLLFGLNPSDSSRSGHHSSYSFNGHITDRSTATTTDSSNISILPTLLNLLADVHLPTAQPKLCSLAYQLIYTLLKHPKEMGGVGRSLRSQDFFYRQLAALDASLNASSIAGQVISAPELHALIQPSQYESIPESFQMQVLKQQEQQLYAPLMEQRGWLLKSIALELHTTRGTNRTYAAHLLDILFTSQVGGGLAQQGNTETTGGKKKNKSLYSTETDRPYLPGMEWQTAEYQAPIQQQRMKMRELLDALEIALVEPLPITQGSLYFGQQSAPAAEVSTFIDLASCTILDSRGFSSVDMRLLYGQLAATQDKIRADYTLSPQQSAEMIAEETVVLRRAVAWNRFQQILRAQYHILEAWREVLEVSLIECYHLLDTNSKEAALYEILETLLSRLNSPDLKVQIGLPLTSCILMLTAKLRQLTFPVHVAQLRSIEDSQSFAGQPSKSDHLMQDPTSAFSTQNAAGDSGTFSSLAQGLLSTSSPAYVPVDQLLVILKGLMSSLLRQGTTLEMRGNLYGALLNYLQFTQRSTAEVVLLASSETFSDFWISDEEISHTGLPQQQQQQRQLYLGTIRHLHSVSERLMEVLASDASDAPHLWKSIAFATIDALCTYEKGLLSKTGSSYASAFSMSGGNKWLFHLTRQGLLRYLLEALVQEDDALLSDVLLPNADSMNDLYVYESKMSMLLSMASSPSGALSLVDSSLIQVLAKFQCIDHFHQPYETSLVSEKMEVIGETWLPPVHERYEQILLPVLRLLVSVFNQLPRNADVASQIIDFIEAHAELITTLLKDKIPVPTKASLQQLVLVSSLFYHLIPHDAILTRRLHIQASKYRTYLVALLSKYSGILAEQRPSSVSSYGHNSAPHATSTDPSDSLRPYLLDLIRNLTGICRRLSVGLAYGKSSPTSTNPSVVASSSAATTNESYDSSTNVTSAMRKPGAILFSHSCAVTAVTGLHTGASTPKPAMQLGSRDQPPLAILIIQIGSCLNQLSIVRDETLATTKKLQTVNQCKSGELISIIRSGSHGVGIFGLDADVSSLSVERTSSHQLQQAAQHVLGVKIAEQRSRIATLYQILENTMFVLWRHLSHFLADNDKEETQSKLLMTGTSKAAKLDKDQIQREATSSLGPLYVKLGQLHQLSKHQTHIIPTLTRRLKDVLNDNN